MPEKRDQAPTGSSVETRDVRRRQLANERLRRFRERQRSNRTIEPTHEQLQQGEQIINLALTEEEDAAVTLTQLGLRVQDVTLAQDFGDAQYQRRAVPCDEHTTMYQTSEQADGNHSQRRSALLEGRFTANASVEPSSTHGQQSSSQLRHPLPTGDASSPSLTQHHNRDRSVSNPSRESQRSSSNSSRSSAVFMPDDNSMAGLPDTNETTAQEAPVQDADGFLEVDEVVGERWKGDIHTSDDESAYSFASERSIHSDGEDLDQQPSDLEHMKEKLYDQLIGGFHGCSQQQHDEKLREHVEAAGDNHYGLDEIFNDPSFPSVLDSIQHDLSRATRAV